MAKKALYKGYNFKVFLGLFPAAFTKISGIERGLEVETYAEGGLNTKAYSLLTQVQSEKTMIFERGITTSALALSTYLPGYTLDEDISIFLLDDAGIPFRAYFLFGCTIKKITLGPLDANKSEIAIETLEVLYNEVERVNIQLTMP